MQHKGIDYSVTARGGMGQWTWRFQPLVGTEKIGHVRGQRAWADTIAKRGIDIWLLMNPVSAAGFGSPATPSQQHYSEAAE